MKKYFLYIFLFFLIACSSTYGQIHSVNIFADYSLPLSKRIAVTEIDAVGGGVELRINFIGSFYISLTGAYNLYSLSQDSAIAQWDWRFWETRYRGIVNANLAADPTLSATLSPAQKMDLLSLILTFNTEFEIIPHLYIKPFAGGGVLFYTRRLFLEETWQKRFDSEDYTFEYSYRNFATDKTGNPFAVTGGIDIEYLVADFLRISTGFKYLQVLKTNGVRYDQFPFENSLNIKAGLTFIY